jgi:hypothetical protein
MEINGVLNGCCQWEKIDETTPETQKILLAEK